MFDFLKIVKSPEHRKAWFVAIIADAIQVIGLPLFVAGAISPADDALDVATALILSRILGWHWAFLPSVAAKLVPGLDLFPTWTAAVFFVTRKEIRSAATPDLTTSEPEILRPEQIPPARRA
jgi:hypothetical protein